MAARGVRADIKPCGTARKRPVFSAFLDRYRNLVERFFGKLKVSGAVATRYDKRDDAFPPRSNSPPPVSGCATIKPVT